MCGIAGIISTDKRLLNRDNLQRMTDALSHRGPDGEGFWMNVNSTVGFGHRRLSIIDLSASAAQPMHYLDRYTIIYNGEIYNYIELKEILQKQGYHFKSKTDTEVILAAYDYWKEECLFRFDGMFAFAIYDAIEDTLFAARDRFGEKPFYYYKDDDHLFFASEMKALWALGINKEVNPKMLLNYLTIGYVQNTVDKKETFFKSISSLTPAHYLKLNISSKNFEIKTYWRLNKEYGVKISDKEAIEKFTELFTTSIKRRLRSDVPVGTSLSGGLDSSSIVTIINQLYATGCADYKPACFSAVFPGFEKDETPYINSVINKFRLNSFTVRPSADELITTFKKICYHQEEPFHSSSVYAQYKVFELATQNNVKVLLDGQGADESLAGYSKYIHWYLQEIIGHRKLQLAGKEMKALRRNQVPIQWSVKNVLATFFPPHVAVFLEKKAYKKITGHTDLTNDFINSFKGMEWGGIFKPIVTNLNDILYFNTIQFGLEELLRFADRNSMAHGREVRLPFLSHELIEFIFSLPANFKIHDGWTKWILRKSMDKRLPDDIVWRKNKIGYEPPQEQWMTDPHLQDYIHEARKKLVDKNILRPETLNKKITPLPAYKEENYDWRYLCAAELLS
ncbi:asparagine synthase (glutamine-hydrolyzing) [Ferruginibacter albus]|uniref:asparagine synthase (glutamine-hydrolyzing) n=1 Tax=Ferruginibacter albus TaxID=2875540 RepID=UPI001CC7344A|nr:asparagine synthase (glutamine-hydrolyzing) [Ferruginibacter albus]UAY52057.1 asparagine synthase (glutamine-hydrolyzing) [Ferruginibacter albus]